MKNLYKLLPVAIVALLASCTRIEIEPSVLEAKKMVVTMSTEKSKTTLIAEGNTYTPKWTAGDKLGIFVRNGSQYVDQNIPSAELASSMFDATFTATVTSPKEDCTYDFYTYYPYNDIENSSYDNIRVEIPTIQNPENDSFDPLADILTGYPVSVEVEAGATTCDKLHLQFLRKTAVIIFTPTSCTGFDGITGETYTTEVQIEFDKNITGVAHWDVRSMDDIVLENNGASKKVTVQYEADSHKISDPIWISIAPTEEVGSMSFSIKVGENTYLHGSVDLSSNKKTFDANSVKKFNIPITAGKWDLVQFSNQYSKVTSTPATWDGTYLIVCEDKNYAFDASKSSTDLDKDGNSVDVTIENNAIKGNYTDNTFEIASVENGYSIKSSKNNYFIGRTASSNGLDRNSDALLNTISLNDDNSMCIKGTGGCTMAMYWQSNTYRFRYYFTPGDNHKKVYLYKFGYTPQPVQPIIGDKTIDQVVADGVTGATFTVNVANLGKNTISASYDGTIVSAASIEKVDGVYTVTYTVSKNTGDVREGWIRLTAGETIKQYAVSQASGVVAPVITAEDQEVTYEEGNGKTFDVTITNVLVAPNCTADGTVVTSASIDLKEGTTYKVTYAVSENQTLASRNGNITITCGSTEKEVKIVQSINPNTKIYEQVTSLSNVTPGRYMIVAKTKTLTGYLKYAASTSSAPEYISGLSISSDNKISVTNDDVMYWDFTGTTSAMTIKHGNDYLYATNTNNGIRIGDTSDTWNIEQHNDEATSFKIKEKNNSRFCGVYSNSDWRSYTTYNATNYTNDSGSSKIMLFKLNDGKQDSNIAFSAPTKSLGLDDEVVNMPTVTKSNTGAVTYTSSTPSVATINASTGVVTLVGVGNTTIMASVPADEIYRAGSASYTLTVTEPSTRAFSVNASSINIVATGETGKTVNVTASNKVVWSMLVENGITVTSCTATKDGDNYKGSGVITFSVAENTGVQRTLPIILSTSTPYVETSEITVNVVQAGAVVAKSFTVSPLSIADVAVAGESKQFSISTTSTETWTIEGDELLTLTIVSGNAEAVDNIATGTGDATISVAVPANTGAARDLNVVVTTEDELVPSASRSQTVVISQLAGSKYYNKVTSITSGKKYILVVNTYNKIFDGGNVATTTPAVDATGLIINNKIVSNATTDSYAITISSSTSKSGKYELKLSTGKYLVVNPSTSSNGNLTASTTAEAISINSVTGGGVQFVSTNRSARGIAYRTDANGFKNYATSNFSSSGYSGTFTLYEYTE